MASLPATSDRQSREHDFPDKQTLGKKDFNSVMNFEKVTGAVSMGPPPSSEASAVLLSSSRDGSQEQQF